MTDHADAPVPVDLSTTYLGLPLRTPLIASAGPLTARLEPLQALEDNGIAAVVLPSLFEEEVRAETTYGRGPSEPGHDADLRTTSYFTELLGYSSIAERYLQHVRTAKEHLSVPVIGSVNGVTPGGWVTAARTIVDAGVDALELNLYDVVTDLDVTADEVESAHLTLVSQVRAAVPVPLAVKVGPYYTAFGSMARRLVDAGADALVLFNRFYQPDIDPDTRQVRPSLDMSRPSEIRLPLRWTAIVSGRLDVELAVSGGVHRGRDVAQAVLAGAHAVMMTSALIDQGPAHVGVVEAELARWVRRMRPQALAPLRGAVSHRTVDDPSPFGRSDYRGTLAGYANTFHAAWGFGPT